jgi:DNA-binding beta-propeller fold protein YncE
MSGSALLRNALILLLICPLAACGGGAAGDASDRDAPGRPAGGSGLRGLWIGQESERVKLVDLDTNDDLANIELPGEPAQLALGAGSLWVAVDGGALLRVDPRSHEVIATIDLGGKASGVTADGDTVWAMHGGDGKEVEPEIVRIDPATNTVTTRVKVGEVTDQPKDIVARGGSVWVLLSNSFGIARIEAATGRVAEHLRLGQRGGYGYGELAVTDKAVYVVDEYSNILYTLTPAPLAVRTQVPIPKDWTGWWAADDRALYFANVDAETILVVKPDDASVLRELPLTGRPRVLQVVRNRLVVAVRYGDILVFDTASGARLIHLPGNSAVALAAE